MSFLAEKPPVEKQEWRETLVHQLSYKEKQRKDKPGSDVAKLLGCVCDILRNRGGLGNLKLIEEGKGNKYWVYSTCPLHRDLPNK